MDIPYLGALFRTTRSREQKRDLLIMVTPHIVDDRG
jgi:type II secretory pathway component HofQ